MVKLVMVKWQVDTGQVTSGHWSSTRLVVVKWPVAKMGSDQNGQWSSCRWAVVKWQVDTGWVVVKWQVETGQMAGGQWLSGRRTLRSGGRVDSGQLVVSCWSGNRVDSGQ